MGHGEVRRRHSAMTDGIKEEASQLGKTPLLADRTTEISVVVKLARSRTSRIKAGKATVLRFIGRNRKHWRASAFCWGSASIRVAQLWHTHGALGRWLRCIHRHRRVWKLQQRQQLTFAVLPVFFCFIRRRKFVMRRSGVRFISPAPI